METAGFSWADCAHCGNSQIRDVNDHGQCHSCHQKYRRAASRAEWKPCPKCGSVVSFAHKSAECATCGVRRNAVPAADTEEPLLDDEPARPVGMRASDVDRERVTRVLTQNHLEGRLTVEEFDERVSQALAAKTTVQLDRLVSDLMTKPSPASAPPVARAPDERFCHACGRRILQSAVICPHCGTVPAGTALAFPQSKQKATAVVLAVLLSFWTWLYTYKRDAWKFWVGLAICITTFWMYFLPPLAVWIWAIVDTSVKDDAFYRRFPNHA